MKVPRFYRWGGGVSYKWSFGWLAGLDNDLVCILPIVITRERECYALSPVCSSRPLAFIAMTLKAILLKIVWNLKS